MQNKLLTIILVVITVPVFGQVPGDGDSTATGSNTIMELIETNIEENSSNADFNTILEQLAYFEKHPINLNSATPEDLEALGLLSEYQINMIMDHRQTYGSFVDAGEMYSLPGFDSRTVELLLPYFTATGKADEARKTVWESIKGGRHTFMARTQRILETQKGFTSSDGTTPPAYNGNPWKYYLRYRYQTGTHFSAGFTLEKDAGEDFFTGSNEVKNGQFYRGFDYHSAHLYFRTNSFVKEVALGDYSLSFGQGLIMWNSLAFRKSAYVLQGKKMGPEMKPYTSVNEARFLRGGSFHLGYKTWDFIGFASYKNIDANVTAIDSLNNAVAEVSSLLEDGLHRTDGEIADENAIGQFLVGGRLTKSFGNSLKIGLTHVYTQLAAPLNKTPRPDNQFEFSGSTLNNIGIDYSFVSRKLQLFGEAAVTHTGGAAFLNGAILHIDPAVDLMLIHRDYSRDYFSFYSNAFADRSDPINERGLYFGAEIRPAKDWIVMAYFDAYQNPWLRFGIDAPGRALDYLVQVNYAPTGTLQMYARVKDEKKPDNAVDNTTVADYTVATRQTKFRYHLDYQPFYWLRFKTRFEYVRWDDGVNAVENGYMVYQDIQYKFKSNIGLKLTGRISYFDTPSFSSAIYAYENDVLYSFSVPAYFYRGTRYYLLVQKSFGKRFDMWLRFSRTFLTNRDIISSGNNEIDGNTQSEIKFQVMYKF